MTPSLPRVLLHAEGAVVLAAALVTYAHLDAGWGWFALFLLAPDLSMVGYAAGPRTGAAAYNAAHTYAGPALVAAVGLLTGHPWAYPAAVIWAAHVGMDRLLGYGLKYPTGFKDTHLQRA